MTPDRIYHRTRNNLVAKVSQAFIETSKKKSWFV